MNIAERNKLILPGNVRTRSQYRAFLLQQQNTSNASLEAINEAEQRREIQIQPARGPAGTLEDGTHSTITATESFHSASSPVLSTETTCLPVRLRSRRPLILRSATATSSETLPVLSTPNVVAENEVNPGTMICIICFDVWKKPIAMPCGHIYCELCVKTLLSYNDVPRCPHCQMYISSFSFLRIYP